MENDEIVWVDDAFPGDIMGYENEGIRREHGNRIRYSR